MLCFTGTALMLETGPRKGRLLVSSHHGAYQYDTVAVSDDGGGTWRTIAQTFPQMDESALTQLPNGSVMLNMRRSPQLHQRVRQVAAPFFLYFGCFELDLRGAYPGAGCRHLLSALNTGQWRADLTFYRPFSRLQGRGVAVSNDGGDTFGPISFDSRLETPVCQGSIVSFGGATYFSNPASSSGRNHLTIKRSTDNTVTWAKSLLVEAGNSAGYSCLVKGALQGGNGKASTDGGLLYEAVGGTIKFARFPLSL